MYGLSVALCSFILLTASIQDWKKREVDDLCWIALCILGSAMLFIYDGNVLALIGNVILTALLFSEQLSGWLAVPPAIAASSCLILTFDPHYMMIPIMFFSFFGMYCSGILKGGADAKALISISMAFPFFPECTIIGPVFPAGYVFCPSFCTLMMSLVLTLISAVPLALRNMMNGNGLSISRTMDLDEAERSFVWPVEDAKDGLKVRIRPDDDSGVYGRLRNAGFKDVRVTWKIPFIIPVTASFIMTMSVGSPLFLLI